MKLNETRRWKSVRISEAACLAAGEAYKTIFWPTPGLKKRTFDTESQQRGLSLRHLLVPSCGELIVIIVIFRHKQTKSIKISQILFFCISFGLVGCQQSSQRPNHSSVKFVSIGPEQLFLEFLPMPLKNQQLEALLAFRDILTPWRERCRWEKSRSCICAVLARTCDSRVHVTWKDPENVPTEKSDRNSFFFRSFSRLCSSSSSPSAPPPPPLTLPSTPSLESYNHDNLLKAWKRNAAANMAMVTVRTWRKRAAQAKKRTWPKITWRASEKKLKQNKSKNVRKILCHDTLSYKFLQGHFHGRIFFQTNSSNGVRKEINNKKQTVGYHFRQAWSMISEKKKTTSARVPFK